MNPRGVDLSHHNPAPDFGQLKRVGIQFVALKATEGRTFVDPDFVHRRDQARAVGFHRLLFYHFFRPDVPPKFQATHFAKTVGQLSKGELVVVDVEAADGWDSLTPEESRDAVHELVFHLKTALGLKASQIVLYGSLGWLRGQFKDCLNDLAFMPLWVAWYPSLGRPMLSLPPVTPWNRVLIWQNSDKGNVAGAVGPVDTNLWLDSEAWGAE